MPEYTRISRDLSTLYPVAENARKHTRWTGDMRCPKKGEWYLSGAIVEAYQAPNDLETVYHIAQVVDTETPIEQQLRDAFPSLTDADFGHHASDLYVLAHPGIWEWLQANYAWPKNCTRFVGSGDWQGKHAIDIPFACHKAQ